MNVTKSLYDSTVEFPFISVDICGKIKIGVEEEFTSRVPFGVWVGTIRRYRLPSHLSDEQANILIEKLSPYLLHVAEGMFQPKISSRVIRLNMDTRKTEVEIEKMIEEYR